MLGTLRLGEDVLVVQSILSVQTRSQRVTRILFTPSTNPTAPPPPDPLLAFIQQAQLTLVYASRR